MGQVFSIYVSRAYFALCLCRDRFLLMRVGFFRLTSLEHILSYASIVVDFFSCKSSFPNLLALGTFCPMPMPWWISHAGQVFLIHVPRAHFIMRLCRDEFLLTLVMFSRLTYLIHIFVLCLCYVDFFSRESCFLDSCISCTFCIALRRDGFLPT